MKRLLAVGIGMLLGLSFLVAAKVPTQAAEKEAPSRLIHVVYDDSGSMISDWDGDPQVDTWCKAKYSMEVFAAMLGEKDTMNIYYMSDYEKGKGAPPRLSLKGSAGAKANVADIHNLVTTALTTPFATVETAMEDLENADSSNTEKWLVILTDGTFNDGNFKDKKSMEAQCAAVDDYLAKKQDDISVMYLSMGEFAGYITERSSRNIFYQKAATTDAILNSVTDTCTRIFKADKLKADVSGKFNFDIPMSQLIIFAQGEGAHLGGLKGTASADADSLVSVQYTEEASKHEHYTPFRDKWKVDRGLVGEIATFNGDFDAGNYSIDLQGSATTIEVYYKPNIAVTAFLTDENGQEMTSGDTIPAGTYKLEFGFVKKGTRSRVPDSALLGDTDFKATLKENGKAEVPVGNGDNITVGEGGFSIDVDASYLKYNKTHDTLDFGVHEKTQLSLEIIENPTYDITDEGLLYAEKPIKVQALIAGQIPTQEQWNQLGDLEVSVETHGKNPVYLTAEKTQTPGIYELHPTLKKVKGLEKEETEETEKKGLKKLFSKKKKAKEETKEDDEDSGKPKLGEYGNIPFEVKTAQISDQGDEWDAAANGEIQVVDTRSWWKQNLDKVIKGAVTLFVLWLVLGFTVFKKRFTKKMKSAPTIVVTYSDFTRGEQNFHGTFRKNRLSMILPYKPETGTLHFLTSGFSGVPDMKLVAMGNRQVKIKNAKAYVGKDQFTINGVPIQSVPRNGLIKTEGMLIKYENELGDCACTPTK